MNHPPKSQPTSEDLPNAKDDIQGVAALAFIPVKDYTTFEAEFAITEGDLVYHFNRTPEVMALHGMARENYWKTTFATHLERVAKKYFEADYPRISAQFIHEPSLGITESWWFRAEGFGHLLDPHKKAYGFLDALDASIEAAASST